MGVEVSIVMGSDSDLGVMKESAKVLTEIGIESEIPAAGMAAHSAMPIIGASNQAMHDMLITFKKDKVGARSTRLEEIGYEEYLSQQTKTKV